MKPSLVSSNKQPPISQRRRFLVIEDEIDLANLIRLHLQELHADITLVHRGDEGLQLALSAPWDLVILDLRLPGVDGLDICRALRYQNTHTPIIMLTARSTELDRVLGLELGADDYLTKPFSSLELVARVRALLRRSEQPSLTPNDLEITHLTRHAFVLDKLQRSAHLHQLPLELTAREFDLLWFFAVHPGRVFRRSELLDKVWGYGHDGYEHTVNSHINRLRAKIEIDPANPQYILTVWGIGYKFVEETSNASHFS